MMKAQFLKAKAMILAVAVNPVKVTMQDGKIIVRGVTATQKQQAQPGSLSRRSP